MSEAGELRKKVTACRARLLETYAKDEERARIGRENEKRAKQISMELEQLMQTRDQFKECINYIIHVYKNIEYYAQERKNLSMEMLKDAITKAGLIVPDANIKGIELKTDDKKAKVISSTGQDINLREGSAYRTVMGMFIRHALIKAQPDAIQAIFLDEAFNTLSDASTTELRAYFEAFKEDVLIVGIEQHDTLFQGLDPVVYRAVKGEDGITTISREEG